MCVKAGVRTYKNYYPSMEVSVAQMIQCSQRIYHHSQIFKCSLQEVAVTYVKRGWTWPSKRATKHNIRSLCNWFGFAIYGAETTMPVVVVTLLLTSGCFLLEGFEDCWNVCSIMRSCLNGFTSGNPWRTACSWADIRCRILQKVPESEYCSFGKNVCSGNRF